MNATSLKNKLQQTPLTNDLFYVTNPEVLRFLTYVVVNAYHGVTNERYTEAGEEIYFVRNFVKQFVVDGLFFVTTLKDLGATNIISFTNFVNYPHVTLTESLEGLRRKGVSESLMNIFPKTSMQTNYMYLMDLYSYSIPEELELDTCFITQNDVYFCLFYFIVTNKLVLSEISHLSFCVGQPSCFSEIENYILQVSGFASDLLASSARLTSNVSSYDIDDRLVYVSSSPLNLRRTFISLCTIHYLCLRPVNHWTSITLRNAVELSNTVFLKSSVAGDSSSSNAAAVTVNCYEIYNRKHWLEVEESRIDTRQFRSTEHEKEARMLKDGSCSSSICYWSFITKRGYVFVNYKNENKNSTLYEIEEFPQNSGRVVVVRNYLSESSLKCRTILTNILQREKSSIYRFKIIRWHNL